MEFEEESPLNSITRDEKFDIVSGLVDRHLDSIVENIFRLFNFDELSAAIVGNPYWVRAIGKQWTRDCFVHQHVMVRMLYRKVEMEQQSSDRLLLHVCRDYWQLKEFAILRQDGAVSVTHPFDFEKKPYSKINANNHLISVTLFNLNSHFEWETSVLAYDRWTLKLINAVSVYGRVHVMLPVEEHETLTIMSSQWSTRSHCHVIQITVLNVSTWHRAHSSFVNVSHYESTSRPGLPHVLISFDDLNQVRVHAIHEDAKLDVVLESEPSTFECYVTGSWSHNYFGLIFRHTKHTVTLQVRSKQDCSLVRKVSLSRDLVHEWNNDGHLLSDRVMALNGHFNGDTAINVLYLFEDGAKLVHRFVGDGLRSNFKLWSFTQSTIHSQYLVAACRGSVFVVRWRLPPGFLVSSRWSGFEEGNVGTTTEYETFGRMEDQQRIGVKTRCHTDEFGVVRIENVDIESEGPLKRYSVETVVNYVFSA